MAAGTKAKRQHSGNGAMQTAINVVVVGIDRGRDQARLGRDGANIGSSGLGQIWNPHTGLDMPSAALVIMPAEELDMSRPIGNQEVTREVSKYFSSSPGQPGLLLAYGI